jgi:hypothetical protein
MTAISNILGNALKASMIQCRQERVKPSLALRITRLCLMGAAQPARGVAGHHVTFHAGPAYVDALVNLLSVIDSVVRGNAIALLGGVLHLLTGRQISGQHEQANQTSPSHGTLSCVNAFGPVISRPGQTACFTTLGRHIGFCKFGFKMSATSLSADQRADRQIVPQSTDIVT